MLTKHYLKILQLYSIALIGIQTCVHWRITIRDEVHSSLQHVHYSTTFQYFLLPVPSLQHVHYSTTFQYSLLPVPSKVLENATVGPPLSSTGIVHDCPVLATSRALWSTWRRRKHVKTTRAIALRSTFKPLPSWTVQATNLSRAQIVATNLGTGKELRELILCPNPRPLAFSASPNPNLAPYQKVAVDQGIQL